MKNLFRSKIFLIVLTFLFFGAISVIASTIGDSGFSGIQVDNYYSGKGNQGITQNISFNDSQSNSHFIQIEDGLIVDYIKIIPAGPSPPSDHVVAYYRLNRTSGDVEDATGHGYNGTNNGATRGITGKIENAFDFEYSEGDYVNISGQSIKENMRNTDFSVNIWFNPESHPDNQVIIKQGKSKSWTIQAQDGGVFVFQTFDGGSWEKALTTQNMSLGNWYMITGVFNGTHNLIYVNGLFKGKGISTGSGEIDRDLIIGANWDGGINADGIIDECGIWNRSITDSEIYALYNSGNGLTYPFN